MVADAAAGSPATIVGAAQALSVAQRQGREPLTLPLRPTEDPDRLAALRLDGVDPDSVRLLEFVALAAWANAAALLAVVTVAPQGPDADPATGATESDRLEDLEYAGLVTRNGPSVRIADPRVRSWLYWNMAPSVRRDRHRRLGIAHLDVDARLEKWHRSFAESSHELVDELLAAAEYCASHGERTASVEFAERALRLAGSAADFQPRIRALATSFLMHADLDLAARYAQRAAVEPLTAEAAVDVATLRMAIDYARTHVVPTNDIDAVVGLYAGNGMPEVARLLCLAAACHTERWEIDEARRLLTLAHQEHTATSTFLQNSVTSLVDALSAAPLSERAPGALPDLSVASLSEMPAHSLLLLGTTLSYREEYARARHVFALVVTQPRNTGPLWLELARYHLALNEIRSGKFHSARLAVEEWMASAPPSTARRSSRMYLRAWYLLSTGSAAEADALFGECMDRTLTERNPAVAASVLATQGGAALAAGDYSEATRLLELADVIGGRFTNPALLRSSLDLIEAYVSTNRLREARGVLASLEASQAVSPSRWLTLAIARARGLTAADDRALALYQRALELHHPDDSPFERGRTLTNLAATQARLGFVRESEKSLAAAHNAFGNAGASSWAQRVRQGRIPEPEIGSAAGILTEEEQLIVEKVREGYRNKEIAAELYISLRTVELRLTHIYRKVGARSRSHLAALLN
jgi:DNA-binding CsgD family transcriptional regulator